MATFAELFSQLGSVNRGAARRQRRQTRLEYDLGSTGGAALGAFRGEREEFRAQTLLKGLESGRLTPTELGTNDKQLIGGVLEKLEEAQEEAEPEETNAASILGVNIPEPIKNFFGEQGLIGTAKQLPAGLFEMGKNVVEDVGSVVPGVDLGTEGSDVFKEVLQPIGKHYKEKYGEGSFGDILKKTLVEDPFGTFLDVATVATGGAAAAGKVGQVAAKTGHAAAKKRGDIYIPSDVTQKLYNLGDRTGRAPVKLPGGAIGGDRMYSPGILTRQFQKKVWDPLVSEGGSLHKAPIVPTFAGRKFGMDTVENAMGRRAANKLLRTDVGKSHITSEANIIANSKAFRELEQKLSPDEVLAWNLLKRGVNLQRNAGGQTMLDMFQDSVRKLVDGETVNDVNLQWFQNEGVPQSYMEQFANLSDEVKGLIAAPTAEMLRLDELWEGQIARNLETQAIDVGAHQERIYQAQNTLREINGLTAFKNPGREFRRFESAGEGPIIAPNYVPDLIAKGKYIDETGEYIPYRLTKEGKAGVRYRRNATPEQLLGPIPKDYMKESDMRLFVAGAFRTDLDALREHITARERTLAHTEAIRDISERLSLKDRDTGETLMAATQNDMHEALQRAGIPRSEWNNYMPWPENGVMQWFTQEIGFERMMADTMVQMKEHGGPQEAIDNIGTLKDNFEAALGDHADMAHHAVTGASKAHNPIVHKDAMNYLQEVLDPSPKTKAGRASNMFLQKWRHAVLLYMPRWWLTTIVGSAFLSLMQGSLRPKYFKAARRVTREPELLHKFIQALPETRPGTRALELEGIQYKDTKIGRFNEKAFTKAEAIESRFKMMGALKTMDKESRRIVDDMMPTLRLFEKRDTNAGTIERLLEDKNLTSIAMDENHRFFYNYSSLGPIERRIVRQFVPFWGFYKFATKLAWRLPFEYPGRTNFMDKLGEVAWEQYEERGLLGEGGILPPWIEGSILLNISNGNLKYLSTFGINPVADFATPFGDEGPVGGILRTSQLSPLIQAVVHATGTDPFTGKSVQFSPESEFGFDFLGRVINTETGEEAPQGMLGADALDRGVGTLLRSFPQLAFLENLQLQGKHPYSDSIPGFRPRGVVQEPGATESPDWGEFGKTFFGIGGDVLGGGRQYDLEGYQSLLEESSKAALSSKENLRKRQKERLRAGS